MLVAAPGVIPPHMTVKSDIVGERRDDVTQSVTLGIVRGEVDFGTLIWALPSFWCKMRGGPRIGASPLLISILVVRCRDRGPPFAYPPLMSHLFFTDALNEIGA